MVDAHLLGKLAPQSMGSVTAKEDCKFMKINLLSAIDFIAMKHLKHISTLGWGGFAKQQRAISK